MLEKISGFMWLGSTSMLELSAVVAPAIGDNWCLPAWAFLLEVYIIFWLDMGLMWLVSLNCIWSYLEKLNWVWCIFSFSFLPFFVGGAMTVDVNLP